MVLSTPPLVEAVRPYVTLPTDHMLVNTTAVRQNNQEATLFRYEKALAPGNGEHISLTIQHDPVVLLGYLRMDRRFAEEQLPSREETTRIARNFLERIDPTWNQSLNNLWIHRHDECLILDGQEEVTVAGMKFKCYRESHNDFAWVIVGYNGEVIAFERDTKWQHVRLTEKWLHDVWANAQLVK